MVKTLQSFRSRMIYIFGLSMLVAGTITYIVFKAFQLYYRSNARAGDDLAQLRQAIRIIGDIYFFLLLFIPLSILFFFMFTKRYSTYFNEISKGIHYLAQGEFNYRVHIVSNDEFKHIAQDINLASERLKQAVERGDFSESSKDQLVVNLAHDLRTPLTSVLGYLDLMMNDGNLTEDQKKHFLTIAFTKSQRLERLIDQLFEVTRLNYGMIRLNKESINLSDLLSQLTEELYPIFEKNHLEVRLNMPSNITIYADGQQIARVFENLMTNANRYGSDGKFVDVHAFVEINEAVVQVINYGSYIPPEDQPQLFDLFYTGDKARSHRNDSTGLGLFIAKNIVEQHNGGITVNSNPVRTMFEVRLPLQGDKD